MTIMTISASAAALYFTAIAAAAICFAVSCFIKNWWRNRDKRIREEAKGQAILEYAEMLRRRYSTRPARQSHPAKPEPISYDGYEKRLSNLRFMKALNTIKDLSGERLPRAICRKEENTVSKIFKLADKALNPNK